jgi:type IV secretion system protein VirB4
MPGRRLPEAVRAAANAQVPLADYLPFGTHVAPDVVRLKRDQAYLACWRIEGITFESKDPEEIALRKDSWNNVLKSLGDGEWSLWTHKIRRQVRERMDTSGHRDLFCRELLERYYDGLGDVPQMATELYVTLVHRPQGQRPHRWLPRLAKPDIEALRAREDEHITALNDAGKLLERALEVYGPRRLSTRTNGSVVFSEPCELLAFLVNGVWEPVPLRRASLDEYLPSSRLHFGDGNGFVEVWHPTGRKFVGMLDVQEYPASSEPGMTNILMYEPYEFIETQSLSILNRRDGIRALQDQRGHLLATEDVSESQIAEMDVAMDQLQAGALELGEYHFTLAVFGDTLQAVARNVADARARLIDIAGLKTAPIDAIPECGWFAQLPGNWRMRPREAKLTTRNFAGLAPLHNFARGKRDGNPWGEALALMRTPSGQPFYLNFHVSPPGTDSSDDKAAGNTFICGSTGVGKTTLQLMLLASATKYRGFRALFLDLDRGAEIGIRAMGGRYVAISRGMPTGFNPFQAEPSPANERFAADLVRKLIAPAGTPALTAREDDAIHQAVKAVFRELPIELRRLAAVDQLLPNTGSNSLRLRLKKWVGAGPLAWAFDNPEDTQRFDQHRIFGYDYTEFLDDPEVRTPILMYLMHVSEQLKTGEPFVRVMEEFWKALLDETLTEEARRNLKTDRKLSALGVYVTQSPSDVLNSPIGRTIVEQCVTQIYLPNPRADESDYVEGFKLTRAEFEIVKGLGEQSRQFLVKQGHQSSIVTFDLSGMPEMLDVLSGSLAGVRLLDEIRTERGDDPAAWLPEFHRRNAERRDAIRARRADRPQAWTA